MQSGKRRRACARRVAVGRGVAGPFAALMLCLAAGGCGTIAPILSPLTQSRDIRVSVESLDGPPREVAERLISDLNSEGAPLKIAVVTGEAEATYRMRGYLATHPAGSATAVTWAWDVYDAGLNRAFRLTGEERIATGKGPAKGWAVADEALLRRIAHAGMDQLAGFMASPPAPAVPSPLPAVPVSPGRNGADTVASRDQAPAEPAASAFAGTPRLADATRR
jgi:hypothetical protein